MRKLKDAELFLGQTAKSGRYKIYLVGRADDTNAKFWLEAGKRNTRPFDDLLPDQRAGFKTDEQALFFARQLITACGGLQHVLSRHRGLAANLGADEKEPTMIAPVSELIP